MLACWHHFRIIDRSINQMFSKNPHDAVLLSKSLPWNMAMKIRAETSGHGQLQCWRTKNRFSMNGSNKKSTLKAPFTIFAWFLNDCPKSLWLILCSFRVVNKPALEVSLWMPQTIQICLAPLKQIRTADSNWRVPWRAGPQRIGTVGAPLCRQMNLRLRPK